METIIFLLSFFLLQCNLLRANDTIYIRPRNGPFCTGDHCLVSPDDTPGLENIFQSDTTVIFERGTYHISTGRGGLVQIEHVTNLSLVGYGKESQIVCSPNAMFGFAFNNVSDITIAGLTISQCSTDITHSVSALLPMNLDTLCECSTYADIFTQSDMNVMAFLLVVDSDNITVSDTSITESLGFAVVAVSSNRFEAHPSTHTEMSSNSKETAQSFSIIMENSNLSLNQQGSLLLYRAAAKCSSTSLADITIGVVSFNSILSLIDVVILRSTVMSVEGGRIQVGGATSIQQSQMHVINSHFEICDGDVTFSNMIGSNSTTPLTIIGSSFHVLGNSSLHFAGNHVYFNASLLDAQISNITIGDNATLYVGNNTATDLATLVGMVDCVIAISNSATILFEHNLVIDAVTVLSVTASSWDVEGESRVIFQKNTVQNGGRIVELNDSGLNLNHYAKVVLRKNSAQGNCEVFVIENTNLNLNNHSTLNFTHNTAEQSSAVCAMLGKVNSNGNAKVMFTHNLAIHKSHVAISHTWQSLQKAAYYQYQAAKLKRRNVIESNNIRIGQKNISINGDIASTGGNGIILIDFPSFLPPKKEGPFAAAIAMWNVNVMATMLFDRNQVLYGGSVFTCISCILSANQFSEFSFTNNLCINSSYIMYMEKMKVIIRDNASTALTNNSLAHSSALLLSRWGHFAGII